MGGMLHRKLEDSISSDTYFHGSLSICNAVLDTMSNKNADYKMLTIYKAINLIMLGNEIKGNKVLKKLYNSFQSDKQFGKSAREEILSYMNKSQNEIMDIFFDFGD
ncbi:hypothetical protein [Parafilimonas terrae]|uniref:Uncharacterized protein n=1 Tax=Parafilimonas terrae TaxID=1465490 RepID=A0A1I5UTW6_9BACT|nr:hypothetical protein [Parafilimonas terrae]SFP98701.1 hypothetical protein SAMN05444277_10438 [Parafilimonas terrae]